MNPIEQVEEAIRKTTPGVRTSLQHPRDPDGMWWLDLVLRERHVVVQWSPRKGFGLSATEGVYGEGPDETFAGLPSAVVMTSVTLRAMTLLGS